MHKSSEPEVIGEYYYFPRKEDKRKKANGLIKSSFVFSFNEFYLLQANNSFVVCVQKDGELFLVWKTPINDMLPGEAISEFRKKYIKNGLTKESVDKFLENPSKYHGK